ncbi:MAG: hypothetical protein FJ098_00260, partial [Deltaproteobacteria bacterium]|nr:hypothetical protein [Deltaproteobacteria bacterium]
LGRFADAAEACRLLVDRFPDDEEILDRYEELLLRGEDAEALEGLLRHRIDVTPGAEARNEVRLRLAAVLLDAPGRLPEGIGELQTILAGEAAHEGAMTRLEVLLDSGSLDEALQAEVGRTLLAHLPGDDPSPRRSRVLTALLQVATAPDERLELHRRYASTLVAAGDREAALFHAGRVLVLGPGVADAEEVVEALAATLGDWGTLRDLYLEAAEAGGLPALEARYVQKAAELTEVQIERPDDAAPLYRRVLSLDPLSATALDALERYHRGRDDPAELAGILETRAASADGSERGRLGMELAGLYRDRLGDTDAAKGWLRDLVSHPDVGGEAFDGLTAILQAAGDWEGVHDLLLDRLGCVEEPALRAALLGRTAAVEEQFLEAWDDAVARYRELLELDGDSLNAWNGLRRCYRQLGHHLDLAETDERLLELVEDEERDGLRRELAELFAGPLDDPMRGLGLVAAILEKDSEDPGARQLAEGVLERGGPPAAEAARLLDPLAEARGDWDALAAILAVRLEALGGGEPGAAMARRLARVRAERLGDAGGAMEVLAGVLAATPDREDLVEELLGIAARGDAWPDAAKHLEALVDLATTPARRAGLATRAARIWHEELGDGGRAGLWYGRALEDCPDDASVFAALERLLDGEGRYAELEELYETSLARAAPAARTGLLLKLGFLREGHRDDRAGALDAYREILQAEPRHEAAMARLDALLDDPVYRYGAAEILEPVYREAPFRGRLPRLLLATLGEVEGGFERSRILAEASALLRETGGDAGEALDLLLSAVGEGRFDPDTVLTPAAQLADALDRWLDLSDALEAVLARTAEEDVRADLLRRLALIYDQKVGSPGRAEQKLRALLALDPQDPFALASLARLLEEGGGAPEELLGLLDRLADAAPDPAARRDALLRLADRATASGAVEQELGALRRILEQEPDAGEVLDRLEARCRALGDWHGLVDVLERRAQQASGEEGIPHRLALARVLADSLGDRSRAIGVLEDLVSRWPSREDALRGLVGQLALAGDWRRVVDVLRDFASREDVPRKERLERLWEACDVARDRLMEVELAREVVEQILAVDPSSARAADARLALLDGASDVDQVMAACDRKLEAETDPGEKAELLVKSARALLAAGTDREDALARLEQALVLAPAHALARRTLIGIRLEQGDDAAAVAGYEALAEIDREARGEALLAAGRLWLERLGDPDRAAELLEGARKEGALDREGLALLDRALRDAGRWEDVILLLEEEQQAATKPGVRAELCRRIAEAYRDGLEDRDEYLHWMEEAHKAREDPEVAEELLLACETAGRRDRVAELLAWKAEHLRKHRKMKDLPALLVRLGGLLAELGRPEEALATYRRCEEVDASYLPNQLALARALVAAGDSDAASRIYQMLALRINELSEVEQKVEVFHSLARLALEQDNRTKAKQYLTRLLSIDRDHGPAKELLRTLG